MRVRLAPEQRDFLRRIYDGGESVAEPIAGPLGIYLILYHLCGPAATARLQAPATRADIFSVWRVAEMTPELLAVLHRDGGKITCPQLMTAWAA